jgi:hypothetical protein
MISNIEQAMRIFGTVAATLAVAAGTASCGDRNPGEVVLLIAST